MSFETDRQYGQERPRRGKTDNAGKTGRGKQGRTKTCKRGKTGQRAKQGRTDKTGNFGHLKNDSSSMLEQHKNRNIILHNLVPYKIKLSITK